MERLYLVKLCIVRESAQVKKLKTKSFSHKAGRVVHRLLSFNHSVNYMKTFLRPYLPPSPSTGELSSLQEGSLGR